jgi:radical SAM protein with 4Fe4S-binding SPASM domain
MSPCGAGKTVLGIDSSGYVHPCALYILSNSSSNDLMKHKLADIVESYEFKSKIPAIESMDGCNECKFLQNCFGGCHGAKRMANIQLNFPDPICKTSYEI